MYILQKHTFLHLKHVFNIDDYGIMRLHCKSRYWREWK